jgi:hypothetical protein
MPIQTKNTAQTYCTLSTPQSTLHCITHEAHFYHEREENKKYIHVYTMGNPDHHAVDRSVHPISWITMIAKLCQDIMDNVPL